MLTAVKNQLRVCALSVKYNIMREMLNKVTFVTNVLFMMLNNATFIVQWVILLRLRDDVCGRAIRCAKSCCCGHDDLSPGARHDRV